MMKKLFFMAAFAAIFLSCSPRPSVPERFSAVTDTLSAGKHFALADLGGDEEALLVTEYVYDDLEGHMATIMASVYAATPDGTVVDCGSVISQGTAYPLAVKDSCLYTAGHRFIHKYTLRNCERKLMKAGDMLEVLDSLGEPLHYVIDGDMVCSPGDSLVTAAYEEWAAAEVLSFSPVPGHRHGTGRRAFYRNEPSGQDRALFHKVYRATFKDIILRLRQGKRSRQ